MRTQKKLNPKIVYGVISSEGVDFCISDKNSSNFLRGLKNEELFFKKIRGLSNEILGKKFITYYLCLDASGSKKIDKLIIPQNLYGRDHLIYVYRDSMDCVRMIVHGSL